MTSIPQACAQGELAHLASAFDNAVVGLALVSPDDSWLAVNRALCEFLGYSEEQLMELPVNQLVHSEELEESRQRALILGHDKNSYRREKRYLHKDGYVQWADFSCTLVRDAMGQPLHYLVQVQDITERKLAEQALRTTEGRLRGLVALSSGWYWEQDEQFRFLRFFSNDELSRWCPDYYRLLGRACWEIPGLRPVGTTWEGHLATLQAHRPFRDIEYVDASDPQQPRYLLVSGEPIFDESGRFTGYRGVAHDVSESRIVTQQLAHAQSLLHIAAQLGRLGAWALDAGDSRLTWSDEVCAIFGCKAGFSPTLREVIEFFAAEDRERMRATLRASLRSGSPFDTEARIVTARGDPAWVRVLCEAEWDAREQVLRLVGAVQDISEAKRAESEILRLNTELEERIQQRTAQLRAVNAELNAFSYAVAHDPRAPLSTIDGSASCSPMGRASPIATITPSTGCC